MLTKTFIAALGLAVIAAPASAAGTPAASKPADKPAAERKVCVNTAATGSRITQRQCKSKADWAKEGINVDKKRG